ncbi:MAG: ribonuclease P protein component [Steroidobacteraceae bacterium]
MTGGFPRAVRLLGPKDFERVYSLRRRVSDSFFSINFAPSPTGKARMGLSVGAKAVGNAVARNRVKRLVRDWFRLCKDELPAMDLVVGARNGAASAHNARLRESLAYLRKKLP